MHRIFESFLMHQHEEVMDLARSSDQLELIPLDGPPPQHYVAEFRCTGLVRAPGGEIVEADRFAIGLWMPDNYLSEVDPFKVATFLGPIEAFHPQIRPPWICLGRLIPGMSLREILFQAWEVITWRKVTMREDDALNAAACAWARQNTHRFPTDQRALKRRTLDFTVEPIGAAK